MRSLPTNLVQKGNNTERNSLLGPMPSPVPNTSPLRKVLLRIVCVLRTLIMPLNRLLVGTCLLIIVIWQKLFSPFFGNLCRFKPSCSNYMAEALKRHGIVYGLMLGLKRVCRCHPYCKGGDDPVP